MFTKLFKKSHDPYELGGRWYKMRVSFTADSASVLVSDIQEASADQEPTSFSYVANIDGNNFNIAIAHGLIIEYAIAPLIGSFNLNDFELSVQYSNHDNMYISYLTVPGGNNASSDLYLYLYIVERKLHVLSLQL